MAYGALRRRRGASDLDHTVTDPRAGELRRKLDESKPLVGERDEFESGETRVDAEMTVDEKRAAVHERGRTAAGEMGGATEEA
jgi:hypothetical protein